MPLIQDGGCPAFFKNRAMLIKEGKDPKQATKIAVEISKKNGGSPSKCVGPKKKDSAKKPAAKKDGEKKGNPFAKGAKEKK